MDGAAKALLQLANHLTPPFQSPSSVCLSLSRFLSYFFWCPLAAVSLFSIRYGYVSLLLCGPPHFQVLINNIRYSCSFRFRLHLSLVLEIYHRLMETYCWQQTPRPWTMFGCRRLRSNAASISSAHSVAGVASAPLDFTCGTCTKVS